MANTPKKKDLFVGVTLPPDVHGRVADLARVREWSVAQTGRYLIKLGLDKLFAECPQVTETTALPQPASAATNQR